EYRLLAVEDPKLPARPRGPARPRAVVAGPAVVRRAPGTRGPGGRQRGGEAAGAGAPGGGPGAPAAAAAGHRERGGPPLGRGAGLCRSDGSRGTLDVVEKRAPSPALAAAVDACLAGPLQERLETRLICLAARQPGPEALAFAIARLPPEGPEARGEAGERCTC